MKNPINKMTAENKTDYAKCFCGVPNFLHGTCCGWQNASILSINHPAPDVNKNQWEILKQYILPLLSKVDELEKELDLYAAKETESENYVKNLQSKLQASQQMNERLIEGINKIIPRLKAHFMAVSAKELEQLLSSFNKEGGEG